MKQIAVIGLGRFGTSLATSLAEMGNEVLGMDMDEDRVSEVTEVLTHTIQADATDPHVLRELGVNNFDVIVVSIGELERSIIVTMMLKELGAENVVCKAASTMHANILRRLGADKVVFPEWDMGIRLAHSIADHNIVDYVDISEEFSMMEVVVPKEWRDKTLEELNIRAKYRMNIAAIRREKDVIIAPHGSDVLQEGDIAVIIGARDDLIKLSRKTSH